MKTKINGFEVEGSPQEIAQILKEMNNEFPSVQRTEQKQTDGFKSIEIDELDFKDRPPVRRWTPDEEAELMRDRKKYSQLPIVYLSKKLAPKYNRTWMAIEKRYNQLNSKQKHIPKQTNRFEEYENQHTTPEHPKTFSKWSKKDDSFLVDTIDRMIKSGYTQQNSYEIVSKQIGRTKNSVGLRYWSLKNNKVGNSKKRKLTDYQIFMKDELKHLNETTNLNSDERFARAVKKWNEQKSNKTESNAIDDFAKQLGLK